MSNLLGSIGPSHGSPPPKGDPFENHPNAGVYMSLDSNGKFVAQVIPDLETPKNVQNFNSGAVGNPSAEQIWAFKANVVASNIDLLNALIKNMQDNVPQGRKVWADNIGQLALDIGTMETHVATLCDATKAPKS